MILIILPCTMSTLTDLIDKIDNQELRARISQEVNRLTKQKKFGLVFEEHLPECTPLYDLKVKKGSTVAMRVVKGSDGKMAIASLNDTYTVLGVDGDKAICEHNSDKKQSTIKLDNLVCVAKFGDPIYPYLKQLDVIRNAPDSKLWHTLIEADNFHALQLLVYLYGGMVDCIYIDPPYNSGAKDWKYNNDYIDNNDSYRHSKWLSMMQRRLKIAKQLLNPKDSVLIITIDEKEYLHLGCLLEEMFPEARIQMISSVINPAGAGRQSDFSRTDEYIFVVQLGNSCIVPESRNVENVPIIWDTLRRSSLANARGKHGKGACGPNQFYPIYVEDATGRIKCIGAPLAEHVDRFTAPQIKGCTAVFPVRPDGTEMNWGIKPEEAEVRIKKGFLRAGKHTPKEPQQYVISYVTKGNIDDIESGVAKISGYESDGSVIAFYPKGRDKMPTTNWNRASHDAQRYGTDLLSMILVERKFPYPKSLYAVKDCINLFVQNKKDALIVDFFAGSGTTLHAVNLLNAVDGGSRRCILVTNNEVEKAEADKMLAKGLNPDDDEWKQFGIARYITWPRTVCSILGHNVKGHPFKDKKGNEVLDAYMNTDIKMSDGFRANAIFFHLGFLDKNAVALGRQFKELLPLLWLKAGAIDECPRLPLNQPLPTMMVCPENKFAVLIDELYYHEFAEELSKQKDIDTVYIVTDSESGYREKASRLHVKNSYQLYRDYLDNFRINRAAR